jgi:hypothetical protein
MMHGTAFPVVLLPADKRVAEDSAADPLLFFTQVTQPSRFRGAIYTPTLVAHLAGLRLQVSETLVWRMHALMQSLAPSGSSGGGGGGGGAGGSGAAAGSTTGGGAGMRGAGGSRAQLAQAGSSTNLAAAGGAAGSGGSGAGGAGDVQQVANADLPLQVRCMRGWVVALWSAGAAVLSTATPLALPAHPCLPHAG